MLFRKKFKEKYTSSEKYFCEMPHVSVSKVLEDYKNIGKETEEIDVLVEGYRNKKDIKPLYFGRDQCQQALDLTKILSDGTEIDTPCNGGNIQCHGTDECSISSCNLSDSNCYPCSMEGCQDCQDASANNEEACTRPAPIEGGGDSKYCECKKKSGCGGLDGDELNDCLDDKHSSIINCCNDCGSLNGDELDSCLAEVNPQNICNLNIQAEKVGRVLCVDEDGDRTDGTPEDGDDYVDDNTIGSSGSTDTLGISSTVWWVLLGILFIIGGVGVGLLYKNNQIIKMKF